MHAHINVPMSACSTVAPVHTYLDQVCHQSLHEAIAASNLLGTGVLLLTLMVEVMCIDDSEQV